ncbi:GMC family oxidoreductase [Phormidium sp. CCY1219]|uniref:GMC family oxidoreductase n=1 Tax=Phormidium sp. CCY1219 TaxID=2886104 RepID=UPI002D1E4BD8|nr:GMC family oxidoreductase [Phormidium sp. CCY1219]MEB3828115.1 GMC family oxidoreductase [Phormidium sp. CCY1219]
MTNTTPYDAIIVGSGFGGSSAAYSLAKAGLNTLLIERGNWVKRDDLDWKPTEILIKKRYQSEAKLAVRQYNNQTFQPTEFNEAVGGMSVFYGGASFRLRETDFAKWPIAYSDLEPYYSLAEQLLEIHGEAGGDIYEPYRSQDYPYKSIELTKPAERIYKSAWELGYQPFKIPIAINSRNPARNPCIQCITCDGFPCKINAKNDLTLTLLQAAQDTGNLTIMAGVIVTKIRAESGRVTGVECLDKKSRQHFSLSGKIIILSAGAIQTPALLFRSNLHHCDRSDAIGKNLMRHFNVIVSGVFPFPTNPQQIFHKQVAITHFYEDMRHHLNTSVGTIQDIYTPAPEIVKHFAPKGVKNIGSFMSSHLQNLLCLAEDEPTLNNQVMLSEERDGYGLEMVKIEHQYGKNDYLRRNYLIKKAEKVLKKAGAWFCFFYNIDTFSHAVGTARFGSNPQTSVLNPYCQFWGVKNLFVLDGSCFPSSGGVNPSLTICANSLRCCDRIVANFKELSQ